MYIQLNMFTNDLFEFDLFDNLDQAVMRSTFMYTTYEEALEGALEMSSMLECRLLDLMGEQI